MRACHAKYHGKVHWSRIMKGGDWEKLPQIRTHLDAEGKNLLCFKNLCGICPDGDKCPRASTHSVQLTERQARELLGAIGPGVANMLAQGWTPSPRPRGTKRQRE